jgi:rubrerythrin
MTKEVIHKWTPRLEALWERVKWDLRQSMGEELTASSVYHIRAMTARGVGDEETAKLYEHIADEEDNHYIEFSKRFGEITEK